MARGINKVILVGNLGQDPETRYMPSGGAVTNLSIATSESWKDKQSGEQRERTEWHRVVFFNRLAEIAGEYLKKGSKVYVEGSLRTREWEKDGVKRYTTEIVASEMQMLDSRGGGGDYTPSYDNQNQSQNQAQNQSHNHSQSQGQAQQSQSPSQGGGSSAPQAPAGNFDNFDDDIPF